MRTAVRPNQLNVALSLSAILSNAYEKIADPDEIKSQPELDKAISGLDAKIFDAHNHCDLATFSSLVADDVEFYHDQGGLTLGGDKLTEIVKNNTCTRDTQYGSTT